MNETIRTAAISPLRQCMIDDMNVRRFSQETQRNYIRDVGRFATFLGHSPATATADDVRRFQIEQRDAGVPTPTMNSIVSALRFFFTHTIAIGCLWRWPACGGGRGAQGDRCRQRTHVAQGRAWQRWPVSQCDTPGRSADFTARVVEGWAATGRDARTRLVVPGSTYDEANQHAAPASHRRRGSAGGGDHQVGRPAYASALCLLHDYVG